MTATAAPAPPGVRCAVHPVRPAVDVCPTCARPRCAADTGGPDCLVCGSVATAAVVPVTALERLVRSALAASGAALLGGAVAAQYVGAQLFAYLTPFVVGVLVASATQAAAGGPRTGLPAQRVRVVAAAYGVLGVALGFVLERSEGVFAARSLLAYVAAVIGVVVWTLPPKRR
ncbi:MAG: hypothetical protein H7323_11560 [Frankiales bacterium]|nr:hypothetical protein [Frankiales bacterium]